MTRNKEDETQTLQDFPPCVPPGIYLPPGLSVIPGPSNSQSNPVKQEKPKQELAQAPQEFSADAIGFHLPPGLSVISGPSCSQTIPVKQEKSLTQGATTSSVHEYASPGNHFLSGLSMFSNSSSSQPSVKEHYSLLEQELSFMAGVQPPQVTDVEHSLPELVELSGPKFTTSQRGHVVIHWGNYRYNRHSKYKKSKVLWRCCRWTAGCRALLYSYNDKIIDKKNEHNHV
ncbi:hypothetical protein O0L34_g17082 [Tuta absoluta]|nr:hypothetical protein O0L34_g17082 [Tuta absoluta]